MYFVDDVLFFINIYNHKFSIGQLIIKSSKLDEEDLVLCKQSRINSFFLNYQAQYNRTEKLMNNSVNYLGLHLD